MAKGRGRPRENNPNVKRLPNGELDVQHYRNKYPEMFAGYDAIREKNKNFIEGQRRRNTK